MSRFNSFRQKKDLHFGICVTTCDCRYKEQDKIKKINKGCLVISFVEQNSHPLIVSPLGHRQQVVTPNDTNFTLINLKLFKYLNAISDDEDRFEFYNNVNWREFVLNLKKGTVVSISWIKPIEILAEFDKLYEENSKIFVTVGLLSSLTRYLEEKLILKCHKHSDKNHRFTIPANMIKEPNLTDKDNPNILVDKKIILENIYEEIVATTKKSKLNDHKVNNQIETDTNSWDRRVYPKRPITKSSSTPSLLDKTVIKKDFRSTSNQLDVIESDEEDIQLDFNESHNLQFTNHKSGNLHFFKEFDQLLFRSKSTNKQLNVADTDDANEYGIYQTVSKEPLEYKPETIHSRNYIRHAVPNINPNDFQSSSNKTATNDVPEVILNKISNNIEKEKWNLFQIPRKVQHDQHKLMLNTTTKTMSHDNRNNDLLYYKNENAERNYKLTFEEEQTIMTKNKEIVANTEKTLLHDYNVSQMETNNNSFHRKKQYGSTFNLPDVIKSEDDYINSKFSSYKPAQSKYKNVVEEYSQQITQKRLPKQDIFDCPPFDRIYEVDPINNNNAEKDTLNRSEDIWSSSNWHSNYNSSKRQEVNSSKQIYQSVAANIDLCTKLISKISTPISSTPDDYTPPIGRASLPSSLMNSVKKSQNVLGTLQKKQLNKADTDLDAPNEYGKVQNLIAEYQKKQLKPISEYKGPDTWRAGNYTRDGVSSLNPNDFQNPSNRPSSNDAPKILLSKISNNIEKDKRNISGIVQHDQQPYKETYHHSLKRTKPMNTTTITMPRKNRSNDLLNYNTTMRYCCICRVKAENFIQLQCQHVFCIECIDRSKLEQIDCEIFYCPLKIGKFNCNYKVTLDEILLIEYKRELN